VRAYGNRALVVLVRVTSHQGRREGRLQGEAAQEYALARGSARDVRMLNWRKSDSGEPRDAETVPRGSGKGGGKRPGNGTSPAAYFISWGRSRRSSRRSHALPGSRGKLCTGRRATGEPLEPDTATRNVDRPKGEKRELASRMLENKHVRF